MANHDEHTVRVTKLDERLQPVFWQARASPSFAGDLWPAATQIQGDADGTVHVVWTLLDFSVYPTQNPCRRSLHYSRLASNGDLAIENRVLVPPEDVADCDAFYPVWSVDAEGNPQVERFTDRGSSRYDFGCWGWCVPSEVLRNSTWYVATSIHRADRFGSWTYVALYSQVQGTPDVPRVAVLASNDPSNPTSLPLTAPALGLLLAGSGVLIVGSIALFLSVKESPPGWLGESLRWMKRRRLSLMATVGTALTFSSSFVPWFLGTGFVSGPLLAFRLVAEGFAVFNSIMGIVFIVSLGLAGLLAARGYLAMRSLNLTFLALALPYLFFGCCFKSAPGWNVGVLLAMAGIVLVHVSTTGHLKLGVPPRIQVPKWIRFTVVGLTLFLGALLIATPDLFLLLAGVGLVFGALHYGVRTWWAGRKGDSKYDGLGETRNL
ncbi:MAG: hypothetical protein ACE5I4_04945 [Thermoplasmata archaeon]